MRIACTAQPVLLLPQLTMLLLSNQPQAPAQPIPCPTSCECPFNPIVPLGLRLPVAAPCSGTVYVIYSTVASA